MKFYLKFNVLDSLSRLRKADVLLFCHDVDRGVTLGGRAYSPLIDSVRDDLEQRGFRCETVAFPWSRLVDERAHGSARAMNRSYLASIGGAWLKGHRKPHWKPVIDLYAYILKRCRPRIVIAIGSRPELAIACRQAGLVLAELMHGIGYSSIPWGWNSMKAEDLPSVILSLDKVTSDALAPLTTKGISILQIPHPFLKRFMPSQTREDLPAEWLDESGFVKGRPFAKHMLVSLVWGYAGDHGGETQYAGLLDNGLFPSFLEKIVDETATSVFWRFRLHPVQLRQPGKYHGIINFLDRFCAQRPNAEWEWSSRVPLPVALRHCSGLVTMMSMSVYEAAAMGIPSIILCPTVRPGGKNETSFQDLVVSGYSIKSTWSVKQVRSWVENVETRESSWQSDEDAWDSALSHLLKISAPGEG